MKILTLHVDFIKFKPLKKALKTISDLSDKEKKGQEVSDALVVLTAVEKGDLIEHTVSELVKNVKDIAKQVSLGKNGNIVLYPYAHLSNNLANPETAVSVLEQAGKELSKNFNVTHAPFGYYKEFELKVKGHPLSELSREIKSGKEEKESIDGEELLRKMNKIHMSAPRGQKGLKSNVELGRDLELYVVSEIVGKGLPLLTPRGATIKREIERFIVDTEIKRGYSHVSSPVMAKSDLFKVSGHWQHYKDSMFSFSVGNEIFALRPMSCPFHFVLFKSRPRSYKELPLRYAEVATLFRNEQSGELRGLTRVRQFTLADAHIICTHGQLEQEFNGVLDLLNYVMKSLGISKNDFWYRFSKWDKKNKDKYIDNEKAWSESQTLMKKILDKLKIKYVEADGEAAFYGPKLDLQYRDVYGKEDTLLTVQIDFALPERFDLKYKDENNDESRPIVIHRSSTGATERMMAFLLEKTQGNLPLWIAPTHVRVLSFTDRNENYARKVIKKLAEHVPNLRIDADFRSTTISSKVKEAELMKIPYIIVLGEKEQKAVKIAVRSKGKVSSLKTDAFAKSLKKEIEERK